MITATTVCTWLKLVTYTTYSQQCRSYILGAGALANMWEAVFAEVGVALLVILKCCSDTTNEILKLIRNGGLKQ